VVDFAISHRYCNTSCGQDTTGLWATMTHLFDPWCLCCREEVGWCMEYEGFRHKELLIQRPYNEQGGPEGCFVG